MKIGINALFIRPGWHGGTEVYLRNLLRTLPVVGSEHEFYLFTNKENHKTFPVLASNIKRVLIPIPASIKPLRVLMEQIALPYYATKLKLDVIHGPGYTCPVFAPCARVVTIHDLQYQYFPDIYPKGQYLFFKVFIPLSARTSTMVITDAQSTRRDLEQFLSIPEEKVQVIYLAPDPRFAQKPSPIHIQAVKVQYNLPDKYILTVSSFRPQKNTVRLVKAYHQLKNKGVSHKLVLIGRKLTPYAEIQQLVRQLALENDVIATGYVPDEVLPSIYAGASLFVFPSFFEGFGIPVLEAMACGVPVVLSKAASLPEVGGDAGYYIDPYGIDDITEAMYQVLSDPVLYESLSVQGQRHAQKFSWERTAQATIEVYRRAVEQHK